MQWNHTSVVIGIDETQQSNIMINAWKNFVVTRVSRLTNYVTIINALNPEWQLIISRSTALLSIDKSAGFKALIIILNQFSSGLRLEWIAEGWLHYNLRFDFSNDVEKFNKIIHRFQITNFFRNSLIVELLAKKSIN